MCQLQIFHYLDFTVDARYSSPPKRYPSAISDKFWGWTPLSQLRALAFPYRFDHSKAT
jgi:hypothetical protein